MEKQGHKFKILFLIFFSNRHGINQGPCLSFLWAFSWFRRSFSILIGGEKKKKREVMHKLTSYTCFSRWSWNTTVKALYDLKEMRDVKWDRVRRDAEFLEVLYYE